MSYILHIWEHPIPSSVAEAAQLQSQLHAQRGAQNPKFIELAKRLTQRHPCITTLDDEDPEAVWSDGPLDGKTERAVYGIGIQTGFLNTVVPFVVETAGVLGLTVFDMQAAEARLPGGVVLTLPGRIPVDFTSLPAKPEKLESKSRVAQLILEGFRTLLESHGFKMVKRHVMFQREQKECTHEIIFGITDLRPVFQFHMSVSVLPKFNKKISEMIERKTFEYCTTNLSSFLNFTNQKCSELPKTQWHAFDVQNMAELLAAIATLNEFLIVAVLPVLNQCDSLTALDKYANHENPELRLFHPSGINLYVAYIAKNPRLQELAAEITTSMNQRGASPHEIKTILEYLAMQP